MLEYFVSAILIIGGLVIARQGIQAIQNRRRVKMRAFQKTLMEMMPPEDQDKLNRLLGVLRVVFGLFVIGMGFYLIYGVAFGQ